MNEQRRFIGWGVVREHTSSARAILAHRLRKVRRSVLVAERDDGLWASSDVSLGSTVGVLPLTLRMALAKRIVKLYEVETTLQPIYFNSVFDTEAAGGVVEADVVVYWRVKDPIRLVSSRPVDLSDRVRDAAEDILRPMVAGVTVDRLGEVSEKTGALNTMRELRDYPVEWGQGWVEFRLTGSGALHQYALESVQRARAVDREQRKLDRERIDFYTSVINSGQISLLALMLSNDKTAAREVLDYLQDNEIKLGGAAPSDDPLRAALEHILSGAGDFELHEMRRDLLAGLQRRKTGVDLLRDALAESAGQNGHSRE